jgi:hypothetical protein
VQRITLPVGGFESGFFRIRPEMGIPRSRHPTVKMLYTERRVNRRNRPILLKNSATQISAKTDLHESCINGKHAAENFV